MRPENGPKGREQQTRQWGQLFVTLVAILVFSAFFFSLNGTWNDVQVVTLPEIVAAIEAGEVETLTVRGDFLVAKISDDRGLGARKEANISTVEVLQILGASPAVLKTLPIVVENPENGLSTIPGLLLTFAPLLLFGYVFFRVSQLTRGAGGAFNLPGRLGRSNSRVISRAAQKDGSIQLPVVTFDDVAGAEQAKADGRSSWYR